MGKYKMREVRGQACLAVCGGKHCAKDGAKQVRKAAEAALAEHGCVHISVMVTKCQDYCDDAPALTMHPGEFPYVRLNPAAVQQIVAAHVQNGQPVVDLLEKHARKRYKRSTRESV